MEKFKIVCIDDESQILDFYKVVLEDIDYEIETFSNPNEALNYIKKHHKFIVMVISDFKMPEMTGFELREKMLESSIQTPFVIVTGFYDVDMAVRAMSLKISKFFEKPTPEEEMIETIIKEATTQRSILQDEIEMITGFLEETEPMLEEIEELILTLEEDPENSKAVNTYFRLLHTIKGTSSCLGLDFISQFAHKYEDLINKVKDENLPITTDVINAFLKGLDIIREMYEVSARFQKWTTPIEDLIGVFDVSQSTDKSSSTANEDTVKEVAVEEVKSTKEDKISIPVSQLGDFMESSGELTVLRNTIFKTLNKISSKIGGDKDFDILIDTMEELQKVSSTLQNQIGDMRKVSMENIYRPMKRVVRDSSKVCQKDIKFLTEGEELRVDTSVGKLLNSVLVHLLRNSVDHGIEKAELRAERGKPAQGLVSMKSFELGEDIIVEIQDDGGGLNPDILRKKVIEKGLYSEEQLGKMTENRLYQVIFESGFSTAAEVTSISGRGVGMDMVKSSIEDFGGKVYVESVLGEGCKFVLVIPIPKSIQIIKSLMVGSGHNKFSIPLDNVAEVVLWEKDKDDLKIHNIQDKMMLRHHDELIPLEGLNETFGLSREFESQDILNIVLVQAEGVKYGLIVDDIDDIEEIVVKKLEPPLHSRGEYLGATFFGDGELALILDPVGVGKLLGIEAEEGNELFEQGLNVLKQNDIVEYMRFEMKEFSNYALPLEMVYRLEEINKDKVQFSGNIPLVSYREGSMPLVFIEPGLELNQVSINDYLEGNEILKVIVTRYHDRYFGLVVEEMTDIGLTELVIDTGTSDRDGVLGTVFIDEKIVNIIDTHFLIDKNIPRKKKDNGQSKSSQLEVEETEKLPMAS